MAKYKKKPVIVEAEVYRDGLEDGFIPAKQTGFGASDEQIPVINTLEGTHKISPGDYIITGVKGERYPCKPDIFEMTYEPVEEATND